MFSIKSSVDSLNTLIGSLFRSFLTAKLSNASDS